MSAKKSNYLWDSMYFKKNVFKFNSDYMFHKNSTTIDSVVQSTDRALEIYLKFIIKKLRILVFKIFKCLFQTKNLYNFLLSFT